MLVNGRLLPAQSSVIDWVHSAPVHAGPLSPPAPASPPSPPPPPSPLSPPRWKIPPSPLPAPPSPLPNCDGFFEPHEAVTPTSSRARGAESQRWRMPMLLVLQGGRASPSEGSCT